jgi:hypothetical protein
MRIPHKQEDISMKNDKQIVTSNFLSTIQVPLVVHPEISPYVGVFYAAFAAFSYCRTTAGHVPGIPGVSGVQSGIELRGNHSPDVVFGYDTYVSRIRQAPASSIHDVFRPLCQSLVGTAWELLAGRKVVSIHDDRPNVQFLRHVRNGAIHGNRIQLGRKEPVNPARWRNVEIVKAIQGKRVFFEFLNYADALWLIKDVYDEVLGTIEIS